MHIDVRMQALVYHTHRQQNIAPNFIRHFPKRKL